MKKSSTSDDPQLQSDYTFDLAGRMDTQTILDPSTSQSVTTDYDYDALGRLATQTDRDESNNVIGAYDYTVRADGKRTALEETHWFDADEDGVVDSGEQKTTTYDWTYDTVGRLTDEVIDHWDNAIDQTESFTYDLTGNRLQLDRDRGNDGVDEVITYDYDANDRLVEELFDDLAGSVNDTSTTYVYDHTQQTSKTVATTSTPATLSAQHFTYNLQGRIATVINDGYTSGTLTSRERTSYEYDSKSYRVKLTNDSDVVTLGVAANTWAETSSTEFLADHRNHTGYVQTIRETTVNADGTSKTVDYTFGHDEIAQTTIEYDSSGLPSPVSRLIYGHDGHGSVRVLYDLAEATAGLINQVATFAAYGQVLAVHGANASLSGASEASFKSNLGYSGEQWDASLRMQNLRARAYDPANGRFIGLDSFAGNMQDPQSLHKYAYVHGDPVQGVDPTGKFVGIGVTVGLLGAAAFAGYVRGQDAAAKVPIVGLVASFLIGYTAASLLAWGTNTVDSEPQWYAAKQSPSKASNVAIQTYEDNVYHLLKSRARPGIDPNSGVYRTFEDIDWGARHIAKQYVESVLRSTANDIENRTDVMFGTGGTPGWMGNVLSLFGHPASTCSDYCDDLDQTFDHEALRNRGWIVERVTNSRKYGDHTALHNYYVAGFRIKRVAASSTPPVSPLTVFSPPIAVHVGQPQWILDPWQRGRPDLYNPKAHLSVWPTEVVSPELE